MFDVIIMNGSRVIAMIAGMESTANTISDDSIKKQESGKQELRILSRFFS